MKTSGGKEGVRSRMYQPRLGLWIVQRMVDVPFSCKVLYEYGYEGWMVVTYDEVFDDLVICKESFLHTAC